MPYRVCVYLVTCVVSGSVDGELVVLLWCVYCVYRVFGGSALGVLCGDFLLLYADCYCGLGGVKCIVFMCKRLQRFIGFQVAVFRRFVFQCSFQLSG